MPARPAITPALACENLDKVYDYFTSVLGFGGTGKMPGPDGQTVYGDVFLRTKYGDAHVMFGSKAMTESSPDSGEFGRNLSKGPLGNGVSLYFCVADVEKYYASIRKNGAIIDEPPKDQFWGDRTISVLTPDGYYLTFASPTKGFKWSKQALESITGVVQPTAPGTGVALKTAKKTTRRVAPKAKGKIAKAKASKAKRR